MGMIGRCPTVDIVMDGRKVRGLIDTGSEVTTVTERWVAENLQNSDLLPMTQVTLKAANGLEIPYSGVVIVDLELLGQKCEGVPVLVVKDSSDPSTRKKKSDVPALVGMNVLGRVSSLLNNVDIVPPVLQPAVREIRLERTPVRGVVRVAGQTLIPAHSLVTLRITGVQRPSRHLLASPLAQPLPRGLLLIPTLVSGDATQRCVRLANLSAEDYILARGTPVAVLHAVDGIERDEGVQITTTCNEMTVSMEPSIAESAPSDAVPCPAFDGVHDTLRLVWIHKDADGPGVSPCHLPASDAGNHVRFCLSVSACLPRRPTCLLQDVRRTHGAPRTTPAAGDRDRSETESQQVPVPEARSHLSWPHDLGWWSELRVWQGGVCAELANTNNDNRAAQLSWLCQ